MLQSPFFEKEALSAESIFVLNNNSPRLVEDEPGDILQRAIRETSEDFDQNSTDFNIPFTKSVDVTPCQGHNQIVSATLPLRNAPNRNEKAQVNPSALLSMHHLSPPKEDHTVLSGDVNQIQIIQHGNSFHSSQILTKEQLAQITQVLQMRQMQDNDNDSGDHFKKNNIIAHPIANTRIVYRVIYPSEINDNRNNAHQEVERQQHGEEHHDSGRRRGRPRKSHHQRIRDEEEDCKKVGLRLSREEKEAKKKHRPRTRSGRISKPPTYMVKDYKRLHHLDFDHEPFDDSDGGYSDYQFSPEEDFEVDSTVSLFSAG